MIVLYDVETTGKIEWNKPLLDPCQPRVVSLGAIAYSHDMSREFHSFYSVIKPEGFVIDDNSEATQIHGITQEMAMAIGIPMRVVMPMFDYMCYGAEFIGAFNNEFDNRMLDMESLVLDRQSHLKPTKTFCMKLIMANIMKVPNQNGFSDWKWPTLEEAYRFCFGVPPSGAHNALGDAYSAGQLLHHARLNQWWDFGQQPV